MNRALTFGITATNTHLVLFLPFHLLQGLLFCINSVCCGDNLVLLIVVRSILLQLVVYLFRTVGENGAAAG